MLTKTLKIRLTNYKYSIEYFICNKMCKCCIKKRTKNKKVNFSDYNAIISTTK